MKKIVSLILFVCILFSNVVSSFALQDDEIARNKDHILEILDDVFKDGKVYENNLEITDEFFENYSEMYKLGNYQELAEILADKGYSYQYGFEETSSPMTRAEGGSFQKVVIRNWDNYFKNYGYITYQSKDVYTILNSTNQITSFKNYMFLVKNSTGQSSSNLSYIRMYYYTGNCTSSYTQMYATGTIKLKVGSSAVYLYDGRDSSGLLTNFVASAVNYGLSSSFDLPTKDSKYIQLTSL